MARFRLCGQLLGENSLYGYGDGEWPFVVSCASNLSMFREYGAIWMPDYSTLRKLTSRMAASIAQSEFGTPLTITE